MTYRRIIQLSPTTKVVSLPSDWLKKNSVKKGDSVAVKEEDNKIIIEAENSVDKQCFVDVTKLDEDLLWTVVDTLYMLGYSDVRLKSTINQKKILVKVVKYFPVYVIGSESKDGVELRAISKSLDMNFDNTIQRIRQLTNILIDDGLNGTSGKEIKKIDYSINTYVSMSFRFLSMSNMGAAKLVAWSQVVKMLELIADKVCIMFDETQKNFRMTPKDKKILIKFREVYNMSFELMHKFSDSKANLIDSRRKELETYTNDSSFTAHIKELSQSIHDLEEVIFQICMIDLK